MIGELQLSTEDPSAQTQATHTNVMYDRQMPRSHRRPTELAVSHKLETSWYLALVVMVSSLVGVLVTLAYLLTWVSVTMGRGGVAPGFFILVGAFGAICALALAVLAILYLLERSHDAPWSQ